MFIVLLHDQKYQKSARMTHAVLLPNHRGVHELVARAMRGKRVRHGAKRKSVVSRSPQFHPYHACEHITRGKQADSCTHRLHARIIGLAGVTLTCALTGWEEDFLFCLLIVLGFYAVVVCAYANTKVPWHAAHFSALFSQKSAVFI